MAFRWAGAAIALIAAWPLVALADIGNPGNGQPWPGYQRQAMSAMGPRGDWHRVGRPGFAPQVSAGWFQRPYPYHLDYYRMRYGGSYAPYFGNLYGPPNVYYAPPYYGDYGAYFGGYGAPTYGAQPYGYSGGYGNNGYGYNGYGNNGPYDGGPLAAPGSPCPDGEDQESSQPAERSAAGAESPAQAP